MYRVAVMARRGKYEMIMEDTNTWNTHWCVSSSCQSGLFYMFAHLLRPYSWRSVLSFVSSTSCSAQLKDGKSLAELKVDSCCS